MSKPAKKTAIEKRNLKKQDTKPSVSDLFNRVLEQGAHSGKGFDLDALAVSFNLVWVTNRLVADLESNVHRNAGISWAGFRIMLCVWVMGPLEPMTIAYLSGVTRGSVSSVLNTLERDGLIRRTRESNDRRIVTVSLTPNGKRAIKRGFNKQNVRDRQWASVLTIKERKTLVSLLSKLTAYRPKSEFGISD